MIVTHCDLCGMVIDPKDQARTDTTTKMMSVCLDACPKCVDKFITFLESRPSNGKSIDNAKS